jgi:hypothetical protein
MLIGWALAVPAVIERLFMVVSPSPTLLFIGSGVLGWCSSPCDDEPAAQRAEAARRHQRDDRQCGVGLPADRRFFGPQRDRGTLISSSELWSPQALQLRIGGAAKPCRNVFSDAVHCFSMTTLSTIGFGDITPGLCRRQAHNTCAVAEGITGQLYLAILVARLVGMQMSNPDPQHSSDATD